jgi:hypothetical protein
MIRKTGHRLQKASCHSLVFTSRDTRNKDREKSSGRTFCSIFEQRSHGQNLRSTQGKAEPIAQCVFKNSTTLHIFLPLPQIYSTRPPTCTFLRCPLFLLSSQISSTNLLGVKYRGRGAGRDLEFSSINILSRYLLHIIPDLLLHYLYKLNQNSKERLYIIDLKFYDTYGNSWMEIFLFILCV